MFVDIVLAVVGLGLVVAGGLVRIRAFPGRHIASHQLNAGGPVPQVLLVLGIAALAWSETQLQVRFWGGWAWLVLIPFTLAVWLPRAIHNRAIAEADHPRRDAAAASAHDAREGPVGGDTGQVRLPVMPPISPMLAKPAATIPVGQLYEPKWDGFRSIIFRDGDEVEIGSRNEKPMTRYFPEVVAAVLANFPDRAVIDGEIIVADFDGNRLDFEALQQRIHPAVSRVTMLSTATPASFVAFDLLALGDEDLTNEPFEVRRRRLQEALSDARPPIHLTPATTDADEAQRWFAEFEGAGLDGLIAKRLDLRYQPDKRVMTKVKHERTADCVVAGYRTHKTDDEAIGSVLLGLYDDRGVLASVGVIGAFPMATRKKLFVELQPLVTGFEGHPWNWGAQKQGERTPQKNAGSRWNAGKDLSFTPLRPERVVEVRYDYMEGERFRHTGQFVRWRPDRDPGSCTYGQLERPVRFDLADVLAT